MRTAGEVLISLLSALSLQTATPPNGTEFATYGQCDILLQA